MFFILSDKTCVNITELTRYPKTVFEKCTHFGYFYIMSSSKPVGIFISSRKLEELNKEWTEYEEERQIYRFFCENYLDEEHNKELEKQLQSEINNY